MNIPTTQTTDRPDCGEAFECHSGLRNNYYQGKRLTADGFRVEQRFLRERRWLLNRAMHGWGVVYGYSLEIDEEKLNIGAGLVLDAWGRELLHLEETLEVDDLILLSADGLSAEHPYLLSAHYAEQSLEPEIVGGPCQCKHHEFQYTCETVRFSIRPASSADCCRDFECEFECECGRPCPENSANAAEATPALKRGGYRCLCEHLTDVSPKGEREKWHVKDERWASVRVDLENRIDLACIKLIKADDCWKFGEIVDACGPRRLVKRNDLLFDLIRGCDLTRIADFGWKEWHRRQGLIPSEQIPFDEFSDALGPVSNKREPEYVANRFWVKFTRPVRMDSLWPDCFAMTIISEEREGWWRTLRVPIIRVEPLTAPDAEGFVDGAKMVFYGPWVEDGVRDLRTIFHDSDFRVEIEVRGDFIVDCNGQTVDVNARGFAPLPTGNGTPGGVFLSTFHVAEKAQ